MSFFSLIPQKYSKEIKERSYHEQIVRTLAELEKRIAELEKKIKELE